MIIIGDDDPNFYIEAGTYTNEIVLSLSEISEEKDVELTALYDDTFKDLIKFTPMKIIASESDSKFRIAISKEIPVLRVIVKFSHQVDGYI